MTTAEAEAMRQSLGSATRSRVDGLAVFAKLDSTNRYLLDQPRPAPGRLNIALAEHQTAGRGRMGKVWSAPPSSSVCLSVAYTFCEPAGSLPSLSLAIGVAVVELLKEMGVANVALKWPNDLFVADAKLGGILIEARDPAGSNPTVVIGLGLNVDLSGFAHAEIAPDRAGPITDLRQCVAPLPSRTALARDLIDAIGAAVQRFDSQGFAAFAASWDHCDWLRGRQTIVDTGAGRITGVAAGVDADGALLLLTSQGSRAVPSGSVAVAMPSGSAS
jgi:BirA family biotin operon repressor/biotin-[acetyl-CoA-carboxylase] ligase